MLLKIFALFLIIYAVRKLIRVYKLTNIEIEELKQELFYESNVDWNSIDRLTIPALKIVKGIYIALIILGLVILF